MQHLVSLGFMSIGTVIWFGRSDGLFRTIVLTLIALLAVDRLLGPPYRWATRTYRLSDEGVTVRRGLLYTSEKHVRWEAVASVDVESTWWLRLVGLHRLTLTQAGDERSKLLFDGLTAEVKSDIERRVHGAADRRAVVRVAASGRIDGAPEGAEPGLPGGREATVANDEAAEVVHTAGLRELVVVSLVQGKAFILAPAVVMALWETLGTVGVAQQVEGVLLGGNRWFVGSVGVLLALGLGVAATIVRYHRFEVTVGRDGRVRVAFGLLEHKERTISAAAVQGVVVRRNLLEHLLGRARLSVLSVDSSTAMGNNVVLPSLPVAIVDDVLRVRFPEYAALGGLTSRPGDRRPLRMLASMVATVVVPLAVGLVAHDAGLAPGWSAGLFVVTLLVIHALGSRAATRLHASPTGAHALFDTRFTVDARTVVRTRALHGVGAWRSPVGSAYLVTAFLYAGRARRFVALARGTGDLDVVRTGVAAAGAPTGRGLSSAVPT